MKISYKILSSHLPQLPSAQEVAQRLIMHTAEVEEIVSQKEQFEHMVGGIITSITPHPDADTLSICQVDVGETNTLQIVCGGSNLYVGQKVAIAKIGAKVVWHGEGEPVIMKKVSLRGVESFGMICAANELGIEDDFPSSDEKEIVDLKDFNFTPGTPLFEILGKDAEVLEIDNKAINHRPDMFSYMGVMRELSVLYDIPLPLEYKNTDFSHLPPLHFQNTIPEVVRRYSLLGATGVHHTPSPEFLKNIIQAAGHESRGFLVDISNYSLYFYGQPAHIFDADTIVGEIEVRYARPGESFVALDNKTYSLSSEDIVIADSKQILALGGIIGGKDTAVSESTTNIIIEAAHFDQAIVRKTGKRLGIRTDSLNVFEKDTLPDMAQRGMSLIVDELQKVFPDIKLIAYQDSYHTPQPIITLPLEGDYYNQLLGSHYTLQEIQKVLTNLGIEISGDTLTIPFWRKDLRYSADIAEEIARILGYDAILPTIPRLNLGAISQSPLYHFQKDAKHFFTDLGFFETYNYSFVSLELLESLHMPHTQVIALKNSLSQEATHMRPSLIPNLMLGLQENIRSYKHISLFEWGKIFQKNAGEIHEHNALGAVYISGKKNPYYSLQTLLSDLFRKVGITSYSFQSKPDIPSFAHKGKTAHIMVRGKTIGYIGEIHPILAKDFDVHDRIAFFEFNADLIVPSLYSITKAKEISIYQENTLDVSFWIDKNISGQNIINSLKKLDPKHIQDIELFDIFEDEKQFPDKRSLSISITLQSLTQTLDDTRKQEILKNITQKLEKMGGEVR